MAATFAFLGMWLLSLVVGLLALLQLADFFRAGDELLLIIAATAIFSAISLIVFAVAYATIRRGDVLNTIGAALALAALGLALWPRTIERIAAHATNPYTIGTEHIVIALELSVPTLLMVLVQWGLVRRRWLRAAGADDLTLWPWLTTALAGLLVLNPVGLAFVWAALRQSADNGMKNIATTVATVVICAGVVMVAIECYIRGRMRRRRAMAPTP